MRPTPRTIDPADAQDERLAGLPLSAALTWAYLPTVLDDDGRAKDQPAVLNGLLWPLRADEHPTSAMAGDLDALAGAGLVHRYTDAAGTALVHVPDWKQRQRPSRPKPSTLAACPEHDQAFADVVSGILGKVSEQVSTFMGTGGSTKGPSFDLDEAAVRDSAARIVEDVAFLVAPDKAADLGRWVRGATPRTEHATVWVEAEADVPEEDLTEAGLTEGPEGEVPGLGDAPRGA
jgi:hypothetical protein